MDDRYYNNVNISDLLLSLLRKIYVVVIVSVVFSIVFCFSAIVKNKVSHQNKTSEELNRIVSSFSNEEKEELDSAAARILDYKSILSSLNDYNSNSIYQRLDPLNIKTLNLQYFVDNNYAVSYPVVSSTNNIVPVVKSYMAILGEEELYDEMSRTIDTSIKPSYFEEIISIDYEEEDLGLFTIQVYGLDEKFLNQMSDIISAAIEKEQPKLNDIYGDHTISLVDKSICSTVNNEMATTQKDNLDRVYQLKSSIQAIESSFSGNKAIYLNSLIHEKSDVRVSVPLYTIIGLAVGFVLSSVVILFAYLFSNKIKTIRDVELFGLSIIDLYYSNEKQSKWDALIQKLRGRTGINDDFIKKLSVEIESICERKEYKDILLVSYCSDDDWIKDITNCCNNVRICDGNKNLQMVEQIVSSNVAICVCELDDTKKQSIEEFMKLSKLNDIDMIGAIVKV